jgi:hypothetical protein
MAALHAEIISLWHQAHTARTWALTLHLMYEGMEKKRIESSTAEIFQVSFEAPVFRTNIAKLGLLGASLASDVVLVASRAKDTPKIVLDKPISFDMLKTVYKGIEQSMDEWCADLTHVALRLRAAQEGTPDPGALQYARQKRKAEKEASP